MSKYRPFSELATTRSTMTTRRQRVQSSEVSKAPIDEIFPQWLKERKDFQDTLKEYDCIENLNICEICSKQASLRSAVEIKALELWSRKCYFFKGIGKKTKASICDRLKSRYFSQGEVLIPKGSFAECLYFIVKGRVVYEKNGVKMEIGVNNLVGERALMRSMEVASTIFAKTQVECVYLTKYDFDILAFKNRLKEQYNFKEKLKQIPCFSNLRISKIEQLCNSVSIVQYAAGEIIYDVNQPSSFLYFINKGSVMVDLLITMQKKNNWPVGKTTWETLLTEEKYTRTIKDFKAGDMFGERELVLDIPRETKAVAKADRTVVYFFSKEDLNEILNTREKEELLNLNGKLLASPEVAKKLKNQIAEFKLKFSALMEASEIKRVKKGRALWDESISMKKDKYAKELIFRHKERMSLILKDRKFSVTTSPRRVMSTFYNSKT